jgi:hypothetical protein
MKAITLVVTGLLLVAMGCGGTIQNQDTDENLGAVVSTDIMNQVKTIKIDDWCTVYVTNPVVEYNDNWLDWTPNGYYICGGVMDLYDSCPSFQKMEFGLVGKNQEKDVKDFNSYPYNWIDSPPPTYTGEVSYRYRSACSLRQSKLSDFSGDWSIKANVKYWDITTRQTTTKTVESDTVAVAQMMVMTDGTGYAFPYDQVANQLYGYGDGMPDDPAILQPVGTGKLYYWDWGTQGGCHAFVAGPYVEQDADGTNFVCGGGYVKDCDGASLVAEVSTLMKDGKKQYHSQSIGYGKWVESCMPISWNRGNDWTVIVSVNGLDLQQPGVKLADMYNYGSSEFDFAGCAK